MRRLCHRMTQLPSQTRGMVGIPCLCDSDLERCTRRIPHKKRGYSPWYSLKFDCRRHPAPLPAHPLLVFDCFILLLLAPQLPDWTLQDHFLLIHKTYCLGDWIEESSGAAKHKMWGKHHTFWRACKQVGEGERVDRGGEG